MRALLNTAKLSFCLLLAGTAGMASLPAHAADVQHLLMNKNEINPELIFRHSCAVCHGERGNGRGRATANLSPQPRDFTQSPDLTRDRMITSITYGRPGTAMMPWRFRYTDEQIAALVDYIRSRFMLVALDPRIELGRGVYGHFCQTCHGDRAQGAVGRSKQDTPRDYTTTAGQKGLTRERMIQAVTSGNHGSTKGGFSDRLKPENVEAVIDYMRWVLLPALPHRDHDKPINIEADSAPGKTNVMPPPPSPTSVGTAPTAAPAPATTPAPAATPASGKPEVKQADMSQPFPNGLVGNLEKGKRFFLGNCATCHGKLGNGEGPRAYFLNPKPRNFHDDYSHTNLNRPTLFTVITHGKVGTVMPAWGKVLSDQEIANVAEFVFETFVQEGKAKNASK